MNRFQEPMVPYPSLERFSRKIQLPGSKINLHFYDTDTNKTAVFLLHGLGDEADTWRHVLPAISTQYRVIAPDLPGFGGSDKTKLKLSIPFYANTMIELLDFLSIKKVVLVGHSMGAMIAQWTALEYPERVERLILISGSLVSQKNPVNLQTLFFLTPGLGEWMYNRLRRDPEAAYRTLEPYYYSLQDLPQKDRDFLFQRVNQRVWSDGQRQGFLSAFRNLAAWIPSQQNKLSARLNSFSIPTTLIWGENDRVNPVENAHALVKLLPSARLILVPEAGHNVQQEKGEVIIEAIG